MKRRDKIEYMNPLTKTPKDFMVLFCVRKFSTTLGEYCEVYIVSTTMVVENVKVMMVINALAMMLNTVFARSGLVVRILGIYSEISKNILESTIMTALARRMANNV